MAPGFEIASRYKSISVGFQKPEQPPVAVVAAAVPSQLPAFVARSDTAQTFVSSMDADEDKHDKELLYDGDAVILCDRIQLR